MVATIMCNHRILDLNRIREFVHRSHSLRLLGKSTDKKTDTLRLLGGRVADKKIDTKRLSRFQPNVDRPARHLEVMASRAVRYRAIVGARPPSLAGGSGLRFPYRPYPGATALRAPALSRCVSTSASRSVMRCSAAHRLVRQLRSHVQRVLACSFLATPAAL